MSKIPSDYMERVYAGWLAKMIGIRLGAAVEGWTYQRIREMYGELTYYPVQYKNFAADDDSNGPLFFLRALEEKRGEVMTAQDVGEALLNYAPYEHSFFWWGGYGVSTEHTAYLNLRRGVRAPESGSVAYNGVAVAEQIGGQIFIDTWGLVAPGNPALAAELAGKAASVTHGGNGIYGGIFVACAISAAFVQSSVREIIETALSYIPADCEYTRATRAVMAFHDENPESSWRDCYRYVFENFGYDRYPGACHIIPNSAVMILSLVYGAGNFDDTLNICNMCGWDTDCNVGNVATIMGVFCGLDGIDTQKWIRPLDDLCIRSGVMGAMNITDIPYGASYIAMLAYRLAGETPPGPWRDILRDDRVEDCHFECPKSTHVMRVRSDGSSDNTTNLINTDEDAYTGSRCLKMFTSRLQPGQKTYLYKKTYYWKDDFNDSRYDPAFSPTLYPGQRVTAALCVPPYGDDAWGCAYARDTRADKTYFGPRVRLERGQWKEVGVDIPAEAGGLIDEAGVCLETPDDEVTRGYQLVVLLDDLRFTGEPDYSVELANEMEEVWNEQHSEITQFSRLKGVAGMEDGALHIACEDFGEWYTGSHTWRDYDASFTFIPETGDTHLALFRVQGAIRSYAAGFVGNTFRIMKNDNGYTTLASMSAAPQPGKEVTISITAHGNHLTATCGALSLACEDHDHPYTNGAVGVGIQHESSLRVLRIAVKGTAQP